MDDEQDKPLNALDRASPEPLYQQIARRIEDSVRAGWLRPGDQIEAEEALAKTYAVSRVTVRQAIAALARKGLVVRKQGKGTYVAGPTVRHDMRHADGLFASLFAQSDTASVKLLHHELQIPPEAIRSTLGLAPGQQALALERLYLIDGAPVAFCEDWLHPKAAEVSRAKASLISTKDILHDVGFVVTQFDTVIRAEVASARQTALLELDQVAALLVMHRNACVADGSVKEVARISFCSDSYELCLSSRDEGVRPGPFSVRSVVEDRRL